MKELNSNKSQRSKEILAHHRQRKLDMKSNGKCAIIPKSQVSFATHLATQWHPSAPSKAASSLGLDRYMIHPDKRQLLRSVVAYGQKPKRQNVPLGFEHAQGHVSIPPHHNCSASEISPFIPRKLSFMISASQTSFRKSRQSCSIAQAL